MLKDVQALGWTSVSMFLVGIAFLFFTTSGRGIWVGDVCGAVVIVLAIVLGIGDVRHHRSPRRAPSDA
jgi:ABC-type Fe3+-siderophore transport system permease subunit